MLIAAAALLLGVAPMAAHSSPAKWSRSERRAYRVLRWLDLSDGVGVDMVTKTNAGGMSEFALEHPGTYPLTVSRRAIRPAAPILSPQRLTPRILHVACDSR